MLSLFLLSFATLVCGGGVYTAFSGKLGDGLSAIVLLCSAMVGACAFGGIWHLAVGRKEKTMNTQAITDVDHERTLRVALRRPRVWSSTVEKAYTMADHALRLLASVMGSPVCPEWVWADALARSGRLLALGDGNYFFVKGERVFGAAWLSDCRARRLLDAGLAYYAVFVACASQGALTRVADFALAGQTAWRSLLSGVAAH